ncbi:AMP-binding protein [Mycolicibacterium sp. P9-22]|uniref:AMP-binding protein n=1 Tax=Mycolicibacterium sp. P9-22 TaxID=2024613 RepID=UPI0011EC5BE1|nr:AMP-binding protein [Mycolicibacterium sp. P9-22]KAA0120643.1 long-chain fatty acid--CoA ligase [Mycolicibacterium sp. P9-22]
MGGSTAAAHPRLLGGYLTRNATRWPDRTALAQRGHSLTYAQLDDRVNRSANALRSLGVEPGDRVALLLHNGFEYIECILAACRLGAVAVPINSRLTVAEIEHVIADVEPTVVVTEPSLHDAAWEASRSTGSITAFVSVTEEHPPAPGGAWRYEDLLAAASSDAVLSDISADEPAMILYTSGTTGRPKGAVLSHAGCVISALTVVARLGMTDGADSRHLGVPLYHSGGVNTVLQQLIQGGSTFVAQPGAFDPAATIDDFGVHSITTAFLTPTQWQHLCTVPDIGRRTLSLRRLLWGTSNTPPEVLASMARSFPGVPVFAQFGQTEMTGTTCTLDAEFASEKIGSIGRPLAHVQLRLVDDQMCDVAPGEVGEIVYQGPSVMSGYWRDEAATAEAFRGGWFHSGDLARRDDAGFLYVVDRLKNMIISGGENIYCLEVEAALQSHPKVAEVVIVGVPHAKWVETPHAMVLPVDVNDPPTLDELLTHLGPRLASYKKPTSMQIVETLPRNSMGKVLRQPLRSTALAGRLP